MLTHVLCRVFTFESRYLFSLQDRETLSLHWPLPTFTRNFFLSRFRKLVHTHIHTHTHTYTHTYTPTHTHLRTYTPIKTMGSLLKFTLAALFLSLSPLGVEGGLCDDDKGEAWLHYARDCKGWTNNVKWPETTGDLTCQVITNGNVGSVWKSRANDRCAIILYTTPYCDDNHILDTESANEYGCKNVAWGAKAWKVRCVKDPTCD